MTIPEIDDTERSYDFYPDDKESLLALGGKYMELFIHGEQKGAEGGDIERYFQKVTWCGVVATKIDVALVAGETTFSGFGFENRLVEEARQEAVRSREPSTITLPLQRPASDLLPA
jgi:hypothetical protein